MWVHTGDDYHCLHEFKYVLKVEHVQGHSIALSKIHARTSLYWENTIRTQLDPSLCLPRGSSEVGISFSSKIERIDINLMNENHT